MMLRRRRNIWGIAARLHDSFVSLCFSHFQSPLEWRRLKKKVKSYLTTTLSPPHAPPPFLQTEPWLHVTFLAIGSVLGYKYPGHKDKLRDDVNVIRARRGLGKLNDGEDPFLTE